MFIYCRECQAITKKNMKLFSDEYLPLKTDHPEERSKINIFPEAHSSTVRDIKYLLFVCVSCKQLRFYYDK